MKVSIPERMAIELARLNCVLSNSLMSFSICRSFNLLTGWVSGIYLFVAGNQAVMGRDCFALAIATFFYS